jgi:flagellar hook-associated protein 3 FlgL
MIRISSNLQMNMFLSSLGTNQSKMLESQEQISSMMRIIQPSDDPVGANLSMELQLTLERNEQYIRNVDYSSNMLNTADSAIKELTEIMSEAKAIMLREIQDRDADVRRTSALEVDGLLSRAVDLGNTQFGERYVFGGFNTDEAPFSATNDAVLYRVQRLRVIPI